MTAIPSTLKVRRFGLARPFSRFVPSRLTPVQIAIVAALALLVLTVSVAPVWRLVQAALFDEGAFASARLAKLFLRPQTAVAVLNTLQIALFSTVIALVIGTAFAVIMELSDLRGKSALVFAFVLPLMIPPQVTETLAEIAARAEALAARLEERLVEARPTE